MNFNRIVVAASAALAFAGVAVPAQAAVLAPPTVFNLGALDAGASIATTVGLPDSGPFTDIFNFSLKSSTGSQVGITSVFWGASAADVPTISLSLNRGPAVTANSSFNLDEGSVAYGYMFKGLSAGQQYSLNVTGSDASNLGSHYSFQIAAVPEPESYAMFIAGLGLMGLVARRRNVR